MGHASRYLIFCKGKQAMLFGANYINVVRFEAFTMVELIKPSSANSYVSWLKISSSDPVDGSTYESWNIGHF
jgi:hypothetical protein